MIVLTIKILLILFFIALFFLFLLLLFPVNAIAKYSTEDYKFEIEVRYFFSGIIISKDKKKTNICKWIGPMKWFSEVLNSSDGDDLDLQFFAKNKYFILFDKYRSSIRLGIKFIYSLLRKLIKIFSDWKIDIKLNYSFENFELAGKIFAFFSAFRRIFKRITVIPNIVYSPETNINVDVYSQLSVRPLLLLLIFTSLLFEKNTWKLGYSAFKEWRKPLKD